jgi:hypothetical protein
LAHLRQIGWSLGALFAVTAAVSAPAPALAQKSPFLSGRGEAAAKKSIAVHVEGPGAAEVAARIEARVPSGVEIVSSSAFKDALRKAGMRGPVGPTLTNKQQRAQLLKTVRKAIAAEGLAGALLGRVQPGKKGKAVYLVWVDAEATSIDEAVPLSGGASAEERALFERTEPVLAPLAPPPPKPEPKPAVEDGDKPEEEPEEEEGDEFVPNRPGHELFAADLGVFFGGRFFTYSESEANTRTLRDYEVFGQPALVIGAEIYPVAFFGVPVAKDIGIGVHYAHALGIESRTTKGSIFGTTWNELHVGLRYRIRLGDEETPIVLVPGAAFELRNFQLEAETVAPEDALQGNIENDIASVSYKSLRFGLDARIPLVKAFALLPGAGFSIPLAAGDVFDRFRDASVLALDVGLSFAIVTGTGFEARVGAHYTRYFYSFSPEPGDPYVAGGALDQFLALHIGGAYVF